MLPPRLGLVALAFAFLSACALENPSTIVPDAGFGACGAAGQRCCDSRDRAPDAGSTARPACASDLFCNASIPAGTDAGRGATGVCQACPTGQQACDGVCVPVNDTNNCGRCGNRCMPGVGCLSVAPATGGMDAGVSDGGVRPDAAAATDAGASGPAFACLQICASGQERCSDNLCHTIGTEVDNCGRCGNRCALANTTTQACVSGACAVTNCATNFGNCDNAAPNGCETNLQTAVMHCGRCGNVCVLANATSTCTAGACAIASCNTGFADCDGMAANGCETNVATDVNNCNMCRTVCPGTGGATPTCNAMGSTGCGLDTTRCTTPGTASCDGNAANGCEVTLATDVANCGRCGNRCTAANASSACVNNTCTATCNTNFANCDGNLDNGCEINTQTSLANCGGCGRACNLPNATATCTTGTCRVATCSTGFRDCDGNPANGCEQPINSDNANCGACNNACANGTFCQSGVCACPGSGLVVCGSACVNRQTDNNNCGACNTRCLNGTFCQNGVCACPGGQSSCTPTGGTPACVNLSNDGANCGVCNRACSSGQVCSGGTCSTSCPSGQSVCSNTCADLTSDERNCGACGTTCGTGQSCNNRVCACPTGQTFCNPNGCFNLQTDNANCGQCGRACTNGQSCQSGSCACPTGQSACGNACVNRQTDNANCGTCGNVCGAGTTCQAGVCVNTCPSGQTFCAGQCRDLNSDNNNCRTCGTVCGGGQTCQSGTCTCPSGQTLCNGTCVNRVTDNNNCGACGTVCSGGQTCQSSACTCPSGQSSCSGTCFNLQISVNHCGSCGMACASGQVCSGGACIANCGSGQTNCSGNCRNTQTDLDACGNCNTVCPTPSNSVRTCVNGACGFTCNSGFVRSGNSCVACGANGQPVCDGNACNSGITNCSGTCRNTTANPTACGSGCTVCTVPANGTATCANSMCGINCSTGYIAQGSMCVACGADTQPTCTGGACNSGTVNVSGTCRACGGSGQPVCTGGVCNTGFVNQSGTCVACGAVGQPACTGSVCNTNLQACSGFCTDPGYDPQNCGNAMCGVSCSGNITCNNGSCNMMCGVLNASCCPMGDQCNAGLGPMSIVVGPNRMGCVCR